MKKYIVTINIVKAIKCKCASANFASASIRHAYVIKTKILFSKRVLSIMIMTITS